MRRPDEWNATSGEYETTLLLKQGYYRDMLMALAEQKPGGIRFVTDDTSNIWEAEKTNIPSWFITVNWEDDTTG
ncbi:MAG: hypothetical protein M9933_08875 [Chitinophagaceae bacterium]|nr:hypothetical protein [Chitinophagaceae bacterium]